MIRCSTAEKRLSKINKQLSSFTLSKEAIAQTSMPAKERIRNMKIGVIGYGAMNSALVEGFLSANVTKLENLCVVEINAERAEVASKLGIARVYRDANEESIREMAQFSDIILIGVKPQDFTTTLEKLSPAVTEKNLLISIAAGISIAQMRECLPPRAKIIRVMPNTPCLVGCGASGFALGEYASKSDSEIVEILLSAVGVAFEVSEKNLDAVTAVSGSGPAYVYLMIEGMADGGVKSGLPRNIALSLAAKATEGAARMVMRTPSQLYHPGVLKDKVTSPAGTTIEALSILEQRGMRSAFLDAVFAAAKKAEELGKK